MEDDIIEVRLKKWFQIFQYICCVLCFALGTLFVFEIGFDELFLIMKIMGFGLAVMGILLALHFYEFKIKFGDKAIQQNGLISKEIPYGKIEKLKAANGVVEIRQSFFNKIAIGNLYTNFEEATNLLASKIKDKDDIKLSGKQKYIDEYLKSAAT